MKNIIYVGLILMVQISTAFNCFGQSYEPMVVEGARWRVFLITPNAIPSYPYTSVYEYFIDADTTINAVEYKKVFYRELESANQNYKAPFLPKSESMIIGYLREDTLQKKVYAIVLGNSFSCPLEQETLLFDFSLTIGDTLRSCLIFSGESSLLDTSYAYKPGGLTTPTFHFTDHVKVMSYNTTFGDLFLIEGIGSSWGLFESLFSFDYQYKLDYYCRGTEGECEIVTGISSTDFINKKIKLWVQDEKLYLKVPDFLMTSDIIIELYDINGQKIISKNEIDNRGLDHIQEENINYFPDITQELDLGNLPSGVYILRLIGEGGEEHTKKFIVQR